MPYYMQHPEHGVHICYTPEDVKAHEAIGWRLKEENKPEQKPEEPKRRGRKPKVKHGD